LLFEGLSGPGRDVVQHGRFKRACEPQSGVPCALRRTIGIIRREASGISRG
jgi:hypothetical protein